MVANLTQTGSGFCNRLSRGRLSALILRVPVFLLILIPGAMLFGQHPAKSPWPTYRGDLKRTGRSNFKGPTANELRWVFSTGLSEKEGGIETDPIIGPDGTVYIGANNGIFYADVSNDIPLLSGHLRAEL